MIIIPCLPIIFTNSYITFIFLLAFTFCLLFKLIRGRRS